MGDPFLRAHYVAPRVFNISGKLTPVSLKDQMIRARLFADRAVERGEISSAPDHGLLIIGGGACGITAAIRAAQLGVAATVIEKSPRLFGLQAGCATRWLDPSQYDWPLDHWSQGHFPWAGAAMPLHFLSDWADRLAHLWRLHLHVASAVSSRLLKVQVGAHLAGPASVNPSPGSAKTVDVQYVTTAGTQTETFGAVLVTTGFGTENTQVGSAFRGFAFWQTDPFASNNLGLLAHATPRVLISGAGDGALQDFLRICTGKNSAREVFDACGIPPTIAAALKDIERRSACSHHWGEHAGHDHAIHMELEHEHDAQVAIALSDPVISLKLGTLLAGRPELKLIHTCEHLTPFYALNRFLVLLIARYLEQTFGTSVIERQTALTAVRASSSSHVCALNASQCHGKNHDVELSHWNYCADQSAGSRKAHQQFNVVIVRHGISASVPAFAALTPIATPRQILPYYLL